MSINRREFVATASAVALAGVGTHAHAEARTLKISHQFPGGQGTDTDFRDRLCRKFAEEVEKKTKGSIKASVYPGSSLMKVNAQFSALRKGALDMSLVPISYSGGEVPELNIGLMPALVPSYDAGAQWKNSEAGKLLNKVLDEMGVVMVSWVWQAGGVASRSKALVTPADAKGL